MEIKINKKVTGIPFAKAVVSAGATAMNAPQVTVFQHALDSFQIPEVVASLRLSPEEARALAAQLIEKAVKAEALVRPEGHKPDLIQVGRNLRLALKSAVKDALDSDMSEAEAWCHARDVSEEGFSGHLDSRHLVPWRE